MVRILQRLFSEQTTKIEVLRSAKFKKSTKVGLSGPTEVLPLPLRGVFIDNLTMKIDITGTSLELAEILKEDPKMIEKDLLSQGDQVIALFQDHNFTDNFQNFKELKRELFKMVLEDLSMGAVTLRGSVIGLSFREGKVKTFITPHGVQPQGNLMFSISLKNAAAFKNWRNADSDEIPQEELNAAIYRIVVSLSEVL